MTPKDDRRRELFVVEYLIDQNATRSAIAAGYSPKTAAAQASRLLKDVKIRAKVNRDHTAKIEKAGITKERVLAEIAKLAFYDPGAFFENDGTLKQIKDLDADTRMAMAGLEVTELFEGKDIQDGPQQKTVYGLLKKIKLTDKLRALELAGKTIALFTDKTELSGPDGGAIPVSIEIDAAYAPRLKG